MTTVRQSWTFGRVCAAQQTYEQKNPSLWNSAAGPLYQWEALHQLDRLQKEFEAGAEIALLDAISVCALHQLIIPEWASRAYLQKYRKVLNCTVYSWDAAFGEPYPGKQIERLKVRRVVGPKVWRRIQEIRRAKPRPPIDRALFEQVGSELGIGSRVCSELYYTWKSRMDAMRLALDGSSRKTSKERERLG